MKYYIKQKVFTFVSSFKITDKDQNERYSVQGKFMSLSNKLELLDSRGNTILRAQKKILSFLPLYYIFNQNGEVVATIQRVFGLTPKFKLIINNKEYNVSGTFFGHSFEITDRNETVAYIHKQFISWGDTYEIEILCESDEELFLFVVIVIDQVIHEDHSSGGTGH